MNRDFIKGAGSAAGGLLVLAFWGFVGLVVIGGGVGLTVLFFPLGGAAIVFFALYLGSIHAHDAYQHFIGRNRRKGITEYPTDISALLEGHNANELAFSSDGTSVVATLEDDYLAKMSVPDELRCALKDMIYHARKFGNSVWADFYQIEVLPASTESAHPQVRITMPPEVAMSDAYIEHAIERVGCVFYRIHSNNNRIAQPPQGDRIVEFCGDDIKVRIGRRQSVPSIAETKQIVMSEAQITRNIKNRLWNSVEVECTGIDDDNYYGRIIRPPTYDADLSNALTTPITNPPAYDDPLEVQEPDFDEELAMLKRESAFASVPHDYDSGMAIYEDD
ncbi:hypothetical protein FHR99_003189 [Litorivivens lipolytica]|uniref:Uncharacterized protein n=1 Tax=Litorivivens lipolytica TaxID=1524264 RepID=A0A7W4W7W6_9GAMM|nr:hypothetical protein [Litorivivens lipolytica]MBB3048915.1 hypothetical protein [Litorivivens lipolytica]